MLRRSSIALVVGVGLSGQRSLARGTVASQGNTELRSLRGARWYVGGQEKARGRFRAHTRLSTERGGAIALACHDGGAGQVVRHDELTVAELLTWGEPP